MPNYYISTIAIVILYYDYLLTLPSEVERFWSSSPFTWPVFLFYLNRYLSVFGHVPVLFQYHWGNSSTKNRLPYLAVIIQLLVGILLIFRTYALYHRSKRVLACMCVTAVVVTGFGTWTVAAGKNSPEDNTLLSSGCLLPTSVSDAKRNILAPICQGLRADGLSLIAIVGLASAWTGLLAFDSMIFFLTLYKALTFQRSGSITLLHILLRDGSIYFGVMVLVTLGNILTFHFASIYDRGVLTTTANILSSTMISRLMLNLRDPKLTYDQRPQGITAPETFPPMFKTVVSTTYNTDMELSQFSQGVWESSGAAEEQSTPRPRNDNENPRSIQPQPR